MNRRRFLLFPAVAAGSTAAMLAQAVQKLEPLPMLGMNDCIQDLPIKFNKIVQRLNEMAEGRVK